MNKKFIVMMSLITMPIFGMERDEGLKAYLEKQEVYDQSYVRNSMCGVEMRLTKGDAVRGFLLTCPQAKEFLETLQKSKCPCHVTQLKMEKYEKKGSLYEQLYDDHSTRETKEFSNVSLQEAYTEVKNFSASVDDKIARFMQRQRINHIKEYEKRTGSKL